VAIILILESGRLDVIDTALTAGACGEILARTVEEFPELMERIREDGMLAQDEMDKIRDFIGHTEIRT
jgi:hypothetical protein